MPDFDMPPLNPSVMQAIERLKYRVTVGDVATQAGLDLATAEQGLLVLAAQAGGHLQVAESGDLVYKFPENFRDILRNKFWQLRLKESWAKTRQVLFYLVRVGFGLSLIVLLVLVLLGLIIAMMSMKSSESSNDRRDRDMDFGLGMWFNPNIWWLFDFGSLSSGQRRYREGGRPTSFLEAVFSFVFGDGDPNRDLEDRRWQAIGQVLRQNRGAVVAEQVAPYLDDLGSGFSRDYEEFMLPVLVRFGGSPEVSPEGHLAYRFPDVQKTAAEAPRSMRPPVPFLQEELWRFSTADGTLLTWAGLLGVLLLVLSLWLTGILPGAVAAVGAFRGVAHFSVAYSLFYLGVPTIRSLMLSSKNAKIAARNRDRQLRAEQLEARDSALQQKLAFAQQFAQEARINEADLTYTTERDLLDQEIEQRDRLDAEWEKRLNDRQTRRPSDRP